MTSIAVFSGTARVGATSLVYHLAWMFADLGVRVLVMDLDPQADLTRMFLDEEELGRLWPDGEHPHTIHGAVEAIRCGRGLDGAMIRTINGRIGLVPGDFALAGVDAGCLETAFRDAAREAARLFKASAILIDAGPNLSPIGRAALVAAGHVVTPLAPDLFSLQGLRVAGPAFAGGRVRPAGYVLLRQWARQGRVSDTRIASEYRRQILGADNLEATSLEDDPHCLATLRYYPSLMPMALDARKPMFKLTPADGALGSHGAAVRQCRAEFEALARRIAAQCGIAIE